MGSIKWKMAVLYMLLVVTVMIGQGALILYNLRAEAYKEVYQESEYLADRLVDMLYVCDMHPDEGAEDYFGDILTSLMIENVNIETEAGSDTSVYLLSEDGKVLYDAKNNLTAADLASRAIITVRSGEVMNDVHIQSAGQDGNQVADYALSFVMPQNHETYIIFIRQSLTAVRQNLRSATFIIMQVTVVGVVISGFLGYLLAASISNPIQRLTLKTQELANGPLVQQAQKTEESRDAEEQKDEKGDELDILEVNFDDMASELTASIRNLQAMEQMQKDFVANVSHELRTPVTTIKGYVDTLLDSELDNPELTRQFLGVVAHESDRMTALITDLLELSKMDAQQAEPVRRPVEMGQLLRQNLIDMEWDAMTKRQTIEWADEMTLDPVDEEGEFPWPSGEFWILAEGRRIDQVIRNLLVNAMKYSPEGSLIQGGIVLSEGEVFIWIKDNGIGIAEEDQEKIFNRFYRVDKARSRSMGGTGLGLAIAKETTELYGGRIWVESEPGKGSTFYLAFPEAPEVAKTDEE